MSRSHRRRPRCTTDTIPLRLTQHCYHDSWPPDLIWEAGSCSFPRNGSERSSLPYFEDFVKNNSLHRNFRVVSLCCPKLRKMELKSLTERYRPGFIWRCIVLREVRKIVSLCRSLKLMIRGLQLELHLRFSAAISLVYPYLLAGNPALAYSLEMRM